jgi:hypothetical protein
LALTLPARFGSEHRDEAERSPEQQKEADHADDAERRRQPDHHDPREAAQFQHQQGGDAEYE